MNWTAFYLIIYVGLLFITSFLISRKQDSEDFLIASRNRKGWQILLSKFAASIGAGYFITYTGFAYEYGLGVFAMLFGLIAGFLFFTFWAAPRIAKHAREGKFYTLGHFVHSKIKDSTSALFADIFTSIIALSWLLIGVVASGKIISEFGLLSYNMAVVVSSIVVLGYLLIAGYKAVIFTDIIQSVIILVLVFVVTVSIIGDTSIFSAISSVGSSFDTGNAVGFFLFGVLSVFSYADRYQLSYAAKTTRGLKQGLGLSVVPILIVAFFLFLIGIFMAKNAPGLDSGLVFTEALKHFLNPALVPIAVVLFFAGIMSSADTNVYAISSHYAMNQKNKLDYVKNIKLAMIVTTIVVTVLALIFPNVVKLSIVAGALSLVLSWSMIYVIAGGINKNRFIGSIIGSVVGLIFSIIYFGFNPVVAVPTIIFGALGLLYKGRKPKNPLREQT